MHHQRIYIIRNNKKKFLSGKKIRQDENSALYKGININKNGKNASKYKRCSFSHLKISLKDYQFLLPLVPNVRRLEVTIPS